MLIPTAKRLGWALPATQDCQGHARDHQEPGKHQQFRFAFLNAIAVGSELGWDQPNLSRTTFDELVSSGNLGLIDDPRMRRRILEYYQLDEDSRERMSARRTQYPQIAYRLVPRGSEWTTQDTLEGTRVRLAIEGVRRSDLSEHVIAEINFANFMQSMIAPLDSLAGDLLGELGSYREAR